VTDLGSRIQQLDRATAYEAAQLLAAELGADPDTAPVEHEILANPLAHQDDLEELAKVLLSTAAQTDPEAVESAIDGAGHKQLILGGAELIVLGYLIVSGLQIVLAKGKTSEQVTTAVLERDADGREKLTSTTTTIQYGISKNTAALLRQLPLLGTGGADAGSTGLSGDETQPLPRGTAD
jgi:hypothetical protein